MDEKNFSQWYSFVIKEAKLADLRYNVKGFIIILPNAMKVIKEIYRIFEEELEENNHLPVSFPIVIPESNLRKEEEHIKGFESEVFWITHAGHNKLEERLALRPTSETAFYPMYSLWIKGKKDLPLKLYQSGKVWRYETKATKPFIRGREFLWIETHCAFSSKEEAIEQVKQDMEISKKVFSFLGIPFLMFKRPQWDKFAGAEETYAFDTLLPDKKVLQIATTHLLGKNFSIPFNIKFMDEDGKEKFVEQTCYGIGISRIFAALISIYGKNNGLLFLPSIAPTQIVIIPIFKKENKEEIINYAKHVNELLKNMKKRVTLDLTNNTPGYKFNQWELLGVPIRIEIGEKELKEKTLTIALRNGKKITLSLQEINKLEKIEKEFEEKLKEEVRKEFENSIFYVETLEEIRNYIKKGFVKVPFCSIKEDGKQCYEYIKSNFKAEVRGININEDSLAKDKNCIVCGKKANIYVYIARQY